MIEQKYITFAKNCLGFVNKKLILIYENFQL